MTKYLGLTSMHKSAGIEEDVLNRGYWDKAIGQRFIAKLKDTAT